MAFMAHSRDGRLPGPDLRRGQLFVIRSGVLVFSDSRLACVSRGDNGMAACPVTCGLPFLAFVLHPSSSPGFSPPRPDILPFPTLRHDRTVSSCIDMGGETCSFFCNPDDPMAVFAVSFSRTNPSGLCPGQDEYIRDVDKATFVSMKTDFIGEICKDPAQRRVLRWVGRDGGR